MHKTQLFHKYTADYTSYEERRGQRGIITDHSVFVVRTVYTVLGRGYSGVQYSMDYHQLPKTNFIPLIHIASSIY